MNASTNLETLNVYSLDLHLQSGLRQAKRAPLCAPLGVSPRTQEELTDMGLIDAGGSLTTKAHELITSSTPEAGMGVTQSSGSDSRAWTVVEVLSAKRVIVQADRSVRSDSNGVSESQSYLHVVRGNEARKTITLRSDGYWRTVGSSKVRGHHFVIGERHAYSDPSL